MATPPNQIAPPVIDSDAKVLRRIYPGWVTAGTPEIRATSDNFKIKKDELGLSVDLWVGDDSPLKALEGHENFHLVSLAVSDIREMGLEVKSVPLPENPNHVEIRGIMNKKKMKRLAQKAEWVKGP